MIHATYMQPTMASNYVNIGFGKMVAAKRVNKTAHQRPKFTDLPTFTDVQVNSDSIRFSLSDGRTVTIPLVWSKPLSAASAGQRTNFIVSAYNVFWDDIDEIIGVENVLFGKELYL